MDDTKENLLALESLIRAPDRLIFQASSGKEALELLLEHSFGLALLDVQMPEMNGFELAVLMRGTSRTSHVPIVFVTAASPSQEFTFKGYESGGVDVLYKPLNPFIVESKVRVFVELDRQKKALVQVEELQRESKLRYERSLLAADTGTWEWNIAQNVATYSGAESRLFGFPEEGVPLTLEDVLLRIHEKDRTRVKEKLTRCIQDHTAYEDEFRVVNPDGSIRWLVGRGNATYDPLTGAPISLSGINLDITVQKRLQEDVKFLAEASRILISTLDDQTTLSNVAALTLPYLADWVVIDLLKPDQTIERVVVAHKDPEKKALAKLLQKFPPEPGRPHGVWRVVQSGEPEIVNLVSIEEIKRRSKNEAHLQIASDLGISSFIVYPLKSRGTVLGAMSFVLASESRHYSDADAQVIEELCRRISSAVDNAKLYQDASEALQTRDEFMSIASHELKTPLTSISLQLQMLSRTIRKASVTGSGMLPVESVLKTVSICEKQSKKLGTLLNELLDLTRVRLGRLELNKEQVDLTRVVQEIVERVSAETIQQGVKIAVQAQDGIFGEWDLGRVEQIVSNLVSNALKYGAGKPIEIQVERLDDAYAVPCVRLRVQDEGMGVATEMRDKIFERFERAVDGHTISGLGLGLYIVRQIVEAHDGKIWVESELGKGSTFTVLLPLRTNQGVESLAGAGSWCQGGSKRAGVESS